MNGMGSEIRWVLFQDGDVVASTRFSDSEAPSSASLLYRATVDEDASFELQVQSQEDITDPVGLMAGSVQVGIKIWDDLYTPVAGTFPENCAEPEPHEHEHDHHNHWDYFGHGHKHEEPEHEDPEPEHEHSHEHSHPDWTHGAHFGGNIHDYSGQDAYKHGGYGGNGFY